MQYGKGFFCFFGSMKSLMSILVLLFVCQISLSAMEPDLWLMPSSDKEIQMDKPQPLKWLKLKSLLRKQEVKNPRAVSATLTITLGVFGAHRIYMGTHHSVPIFYTLTLGGGMGLLPLSDLCFILFAKDVEQFYDNEHIFMWQE